MQEPKRTTFNWNYPEIGTCGMPCDLLRIVVWRTRAIPNLLLKFDGERNGWVIGGSFENAAGTDLEFKELAFIPEERLED